MSLLTPELLRHLEQFQLLAARRVEFVATPALTPALSPRRGRITRRRSTPSRIQLVRAPFWSNRQNPGSVSATPESPHPPERSPLSPGERARVRASVTHTSAPKKSSNGSGRILRRVLSQPSVLRQFSPANHPPTATGNSTPESSLRVRLRSPLPGGEGQGEGERQTNFQFAKTSNIEHATSNIQWLPDYARSALDVGCWMFDVLPS